MTNRFTWRALALACAVILTATFQNCGKPFGSAAQSSSTVQPLSTPQVKIDAAPVVQTRSRFELLFAVRDLLQDESLPVSLVTSLPADPKVEGFEAAGLQTYDDSFITGRMAFAEDIAARAIRSRAVVSCAPRSAEQVDWDGCIDTVVEKFAKRAFRRDLNVGEIATLKTIFLTTSQSVVDELYKARSQPQGYFDVIDSDHVAAGWSLDPDWPERTVEVHFYINGPAGVGQFIGNTFANQPRPDVNDYYAKNFNLDYKGDHGFHFKIPAQFDDGATHAVYAYAIGDAGTNPLLGTYRLTGARTAASGPDTPPLLSAPTEEGLKAAFVYVLLSPSFQLRQPITQGIQDPALKKALLLANKLSLFLNGGLIDATTAELARSGRLLDPGVYDGEVRRLMVAHTDRFAANVIGQWMGYRDFSIRDGATSQDADMVQESTLVFREILDKNLPGNAILKPGFTYVNSDLAQLYGLDDPKTDSFVRVQVPDRGGILTQGSFLRSTSPLKETKPIVRGKWVLNALLCKQIQFPSADLLQIIADSETDLAKKNLSVSETLAAHRSKGAVCNGCHQYMDPIGLSLENYSPFGTWRTTYDNGKPVITAGVLQGSPITGARDLEASIQNRSDFKECIVRKLMTHALSRPVNDAELATVQSIATSASGIRDILLAIARSPSFLQVAEDQSL